MMAHYAHAWRSSALMELVLDECATPRLARYSSRQSDMSGGMMAFVWCKMAVVVGGQRWIDERVVVVVVSSSSDMSAMVEEVGI